MELLGEWSYQIFKPIKKAFAEGRFTFLSLRTPDNVLVPLQSAPVPVPAASAPVTLDLIKPLFGRWIRTKGKEEIAFCGRLKSNLLNQIKSHMAKYIAKERQSRHGPFIYDILDLRLSIRKKWESDLIVSIDNTSEVVSIFTHPIADRAKRSSLVWWCLGRHSWCNHHRKGFVPGKRSV
ncbi:hypothetical protein L596_000139 [Steinernema carpocapsae]|uniref:Uncharacterized protein n=1 Tax=Steinernema carpocapsae TaxID=34508 RepID=A0A4U8UHB7_STECR|nr:hypothetical protein L596_000139 [Steinernema carpocapsae]